eukprot:COSAG02_NODE_9038_length_2353_cov_1.792369_3_plen_267_part_01
MRPAARRAALLLRLAGLVALAPTGEVEAGQPCDKAAPKCNNHGTCNPKNGSCACNANWEGEYCSVDSLCKGVNCNQHGSCSLGKCKCNGEWGGTDCSQKPCLKHNDCGDHGKCQTSGNTHQCDCDSGYTGQHCVPVSCGRRNVPAHAQWDGGSCNKVFGETCTATCVPGWTGGPKDATFTCGADGQYSGSLTCEKVSCGKRDAPDNSQWNGGRCDETFEGTCTATCDEGWTGGTPDAPFTCKADGTYGGQLQCEPVTCSAPNPLHST